jgi:hypothetical protein
MQPNSKFPEFGQVTRASNTHFISNFLTVIKYIFILQSYMRGVSRKKERKIMRTQNNEMVTEGKEEGIGIVCVE